MRILICGTPGVGKSSVSRELTRLLNAEYIHVSEFVIRKRLFKQYDEIRSSYEINDEEVARELERELEGKERVVIETVYPSLLDRADKIIVLRRNPKLLYQELSRRGWSQLKVIENVEAEALGYVSQEAKEWFGLTCEIDTSSRTPLETAKMVLEGKCDGEIDWLNDDEIVKLLLYLDKIIS